MRVHDGYGEMMWMPYGHMGFGMVLAVLIILAIGIGIGFAVGRSR